MDHEQKGQTLYRSAFLYMVLQDCDEDMLYGQIGRRGSSQMVDEKKGTCKR